MDSGSTRYNNRYYYVRFYDFWNEPKPCCC